MSLKKEYLMADDVLDLPEFLERVQDDKELLLELFDIFIEDFKLKRVQLTQAIEQKNFAQIRAIAHSLKGSTGNISAKLLRLTCIKLEELGQANSLAGIQDQLITLDKQFQDLVNRIVIVKKELK